VHIRPARRQQMSEQLGTEHARSPCGPASPSPARRPALLTLSQCITVAGQ
jgi:hypothetical protein